jgi:hypothetical protein
MVPRERDIAKTITGRRLRRTGTAALAAAVAVALAALAAGCGGSSGQGVAKVPSTQSTDNSTSSSGASGKPNPNAMALSACMRKNGVPNFPDPDSSGHIKLTSGRSANGQTTGVDDNSPEFRKAQQACQKLLPSGKPSRQQQQKEQQSMLKLAQCMRAHGVPKYPDPRVNPNGGSEMTMGEDVNPNSPQFKAAQATCQKLVPNSPLSVGPDDGQ